MEIADDCVVTIRYELTDEETETVLESLEDDNLTYLHGHGNIVAGLEEELDGKEPDDEFDVTVPPEKAYGERLEELVSRWDRDKFPEGQELEPGMMFEVSKAGGSGPEATQFVIIKKIVGDEVEVDANHPLSGKTLHFSGSVVDVREATDPELEQGRPLRDG